MTPKLLLSLPRGTGQNYMDAFSCCGFSVKAEYLPGNTMCDGLVLCGGGDISPSYFGQKNNGSYPPDTQRDRCEFFLFDSYRKQGKPIFGICRGMQLINIAMGGDIYQDIEESEKHIGWGDLRHEVINLPCTPAYRIFGPCATVNSAHHQACRILGHDLSVMQLCGDIIEGIYTDGIIGLQWHPERMIGKFHKEEYTDPCPVFNLFKEMF